MSRTAPTEIILSQGRVADRTSGAIPGANALARALSRKTGLPVDAIGTPSEALDDNWDAALRAAEPHLSALARAVEVAMAQRKQVLIIANTCSVSLATLPAAAKHIEEMAVLWIDAHGDYHTPASTGSGYLGGMALAGASGLWDSGLGGGIAPARTLLVGARDIDDPEQMRIAEQGATVLPPAAVTPQQVLAWLGNSPVWIHIDWDVMEPGLIPAAYSVEGGLLPTQLKAVLAGIPREQIVGIELAEFELPQDPAEADRAIALILDICSPLLDPPQ